MTQTHSLAATLAVSGLALASAFSATPPALSTLSQQRQRMVSVGVPVAAAHSYTITETIAPFTASRRTIVAVSATSDSTSAEGTNIDTNDSIDLLDEVDSIFDCVDTNKDGQISQDELRAHLVDEMGYSEQYTDYLFESIDTDSNGSISREELGFAFYNFEALSMYMTFGIGGAEITQQNSFKKLALKSDAAPEARDKLLLDDLADLIFDMIDTDKSGEITRDELEAHFDAVTQKLDAGKGGVTQQQANEYVQTMFATLDADKDGNICREEIRTAFEKYDFKLLARTFGLKVYQTALV